MLEGVAQRYYWKELMSLCRAGRLAFIETQMNCFQSLPSLHRAARRAAGVGGMAERRDWGRDEVVPAGTCSGTGAKVATSNCPH